MFTAAHHFFSFSSFCRVPASSVSCACCYQTLAEFFSFNDMCQAAMTLNAWKWVDSGNVLSVRVAANGSQTELERRLISAEIADMKARKYALASRIITTKTKFCIVI